MKHVKETVGTVISSILINNEVVQKECAYCSNIFSVSKKMSLYANRCPGCESKQSNAVMIGMLENRAKEWSKICPEAYLELAEGKLPKESLEPYKKSMEWAYGPKGLIMMGETGRGKTRIAWQLLRREFMSGRSCRTLDSMAGIEYASKYSESGKMVEGWIKDKIQAGILLFDDVFKSKLTDSFESALFTLVDQRIQNNRPMIITTNDTGETLAERMTQDRASSLMRRLREFCHAIHF